MGVTSGWPRKGDDGQGGTPMAFETVLVTLGHDEIDPVADPAIDMEP